MSDAERARAYRIRKEKLAAAAVAKSANTQFVAERTDAELLEALRQALTDVRRQPTRKPPKQRTARILAEFARRYPCGSDQNPKDPHPVSTPETDMSSNTYRRS